MPLTPQEFVCQWKRVTARERQSDQEHFIDLCFEMGAAKTSGGEGWADASRKATP